MNNKTLSALFFIIPALFLVSSPVMAASSVIINLNGKIKEGTCKVGNYTLNVSIRFDGPVLTGRNDILMLTQEASVSKGAGIQILDKNENPLAIGQKNTLMADVKKDETYIFSFFARYIRYSNDFVTEGSADGKVDFTFICE